MSSSMQVSMILERIDKGPNSCASQDSMVVGRVNKGPSCCAIQVSKVLETPVKGPISRAIQTSFTPTPCVQEKKIIQIPVSEKRISSTLHTRSKYAPTISDRAFVSKTKENSITSSVSKGRQEVADSGKDISTSLSFFSCDTIQNEAQKTLEDKSKPQLPASSITAAVVTSGNQSCSQNGLLISSSAAISCIFDSGGVPTSECQDAKCHTCATAVSTTTLSGDASFPEITTFPKKSGTMKYKNVSINTNGVVQKLLVPVNEDQVRDDSLSICNNSMTMFGQTFAHDPVWKSGRGGEWTPHIVSPGAFPSPSSIPVTLKPPFTGTVGKSLAATMSNSTDTIRAMSHTFARCLPLVLHQNDTPEHTIGNIPVFTTASSRFAVHENRDGNAHKSFYIQGAPYKANAENEILEQSRYTRAPWQQTRFTPDCIGNPMVCYSFSVGLPEASPCGRIDSLSRIRMQPELQYQAMDQNNLLCENKRSNSPDASTKRSREKLSTGVQNSPSWMCQACLINRFRVTDNDALCTCNAHGPKKRRQDRKQLTGKRSNTSAKKRKSDGKQVSSFGDDNTRVSESSQKEGYSLQQSSTSQKYDRDGNSELTDTLQTNTSLGKPFFRYFFVKTNTGCFLIPRSGDQGNEKSHQTKVVYKIVMYNTGKAVVIRRNTGVKQYFVEPVDNAKAYSLIKGIVERGILQAPKMNYSAPCE